MSQVEKITSSKLTQNRDVRLGAQLSHFSVQAEKNGESLAFSAKLGGHSPGRGRVRKTWKPAAFTF